MFLRKPKHRRYAPLGVAVLAAVVGGSALGIVQAAPARAQLLMTPQGQTLPTFEVASIRPSQSAPAGTDFQVTPTRFRVLNATVNDLISFAYDIRSDDQLLKGPAWTRTERFDLDAKIDDAQAAATRKLAPTQQIDQYRLMVQAMLRDRMNLRVSTRMKVLPVYALVVAKNGPKMSALKAAPDASQHLPMMGGWSHGDVKASAVQMPLFAEWLSGKPDTSGRVVMDATGLRGSYDFTLKWTPMAMQSGGFSAAAEQNTTAAQSTGVPLFTALEEQLGLKLIPRKAPVKVLAIDEVEQPSPN